MMEGGKEDSASTICKAVERPILRVQRSMTSPASSRPRAAVALIEHPGSERRFLLLKRAENPEDPWAGHLSFPGGMRERTDADLLDTAIRETFEECGLKLTRAMLVGTLPTLEAGRDVDRPLGVASYVFQLGEASPLRLDAEEVSAAHWVAESRLRNARSWRRGAINRRRPEQHYPYIELEGSLLWGFTLRVLARHLGLENRLSESS